MTELQCKGSYVLGTACGLCRHCKSEQAKLVANKQIMQATHEAAVEYYMRPLVIHASAITPERCCFITGVMRACVELKQDKHGIAQVLNALGVTAEEVSHECVGHSDGKSIK